MSISSRVTDQLKKHFPDWNAQRVECFSLMIVALLRGGSVSLPKLGQRFGNDAQWLSNVRRMNRLLKEQRIDYHAFGMLLLSLCDKDNRRCFQVTIDRTNWQYGERHINYLVIGIVVGDVSVPIVWQMLPKKGTSNTMERTRILQRFLKIVPAERISVFLADREFIGQAWFEVLQEKKVPFIIRLKLNNLIGISTLGLQDITQLSAPLKKNESLTIDRCTVFGVPVHVKIKRCANGELLIVAYDHYHCACPVKIYRKRWTIETCFKCFKTAGFRLEDTHITHLRRLKKLLCVVLIAFIWSLIVGYKKHKYKPIAVKNHNRKAISFFALGKNHLTQMLSKQHYHTKSLTPLVNTLFRGSQYLHNVS